MVFSLLVPWHSKNCWKKLAFLRHIRPFLSILRNFTSFSQQTKDNSYLPICVNIEPSFALLVARLVGFSKVMITIQKDLFIEVFQFSSVTQLCPTLCDPVNRSMPGLPVHHQLPESTQTHVHWVGDAIQPSHPLVVPFSSCPQYFPASGSFQLSQLFTWGGQSTGVSASASVLPMNTQDWPPLGWTGWISSQSKGLSRVFSNTTV